MPPTHEEKRLKGYATWSVCVYVCVCVFFLGISWVLFSFGEFLPLGNKK